MKKSIFAKTLSLLLTLLMILSFTAIAVGAEETDDTTAKNVILMIGDGMGENSMEWTKSVYNTTLVMDSFPYYGYSKTNSLTGTTDSAAGGTALSSGLHAINSNLGMLAIPGEEISLDIGKYMNTCEVAISLGKRAGIVTSDLNSGATPSAFSVHVADRDRAEEITEKQLASDLNLIWASANGLVTEETASESGWEFVDSLDDIYALEDGAKSFGAFTGSIAFDDGENEFTPLSTLTELAIDNLDCEEGFFLMVEGAHIDKNSHKNNSEGMMKALLEFDKAVEKALEFAKEDGNTIVIVTADHETGGIKKNADGTFEYTRTSHSSTDVPVRVYGSDELVKDGDTVINYEISRFTAKKLGYTGKYPVFKFNFCMITNLIRYIVKFFIELF